VGQYLNRRNRERAEAMARRFLEKKLFAYHIENEAFWGVFHTRRDKEHLQETLLGLFGDKDSVEKLLLDFGLLTQERLDEIRSMEENFLRRMGLRFLGRNRSAVTLEAEYRDNMLVLCPVCVPTLKDNPLAVFEQDRLHVHRGGCPVLAEALSARQFPLRWIASEEKRAATIEIRADDVYGVFSRISSSFRQARVNIVEHTGQRILDGAVFRIRVEETTGEFLSKLLESLRTMSEIKEIEVKP